MLDAPDEIRRAHREFFAAGARVASAATASHGHGETRFVCRREDSVVRRGRRDLDGNRRTRHPDVDQCHHRRRSSPLRGMVLAGA
nr:hypothetical protein [Agreia bicolorata]